MTGRQLPLALELPTSLTSADFFPGEANRLALAWIARWPDWPSPALLLHGPAGSGKSHLAAIWAEASKALRLRPDGEHMRLALGAANAALVEDADRLTAEPEACEALYQLWQALAERGGHLLLTAREAPARWNVALPDLASRLRAAHAVRLEAPDDALMERVLVKHLHDRQLVVAPDLVRYAVRRLERSFAALQRFAAALDEAALAENRQATLALARWVLAALEEGER